MLPISPEAHMHEKLGLSSSVDTTQHYKDWPNSAGFTTEDEQRTPVKLVVHGNIPAYAAGTLYRTGPGTNLVDTKAGKQWAASHWFDAFTQVHRFQILPPTDLNASTTVIYNSRRSTDDLVAEIQETGKLNGFTFGQKRDPCQSFFQKVMSTFIGLSRPAPTSPSSSNVGVTISANMPGLKAPGGSTNMSSKSQIRTLVNKTDATRYQLIDPETLEPIGLAKQTILHPDLKGPLSAAHAEECPITGDIFNYNFEISRFLTYRIFRVSASTQETTILATITDAPGTYIHSLFLTANYVILCVWNSRYTYAGMPIIWHQNVLDAIAPLDPSKPCLWYVVDRTATQKGVVAIYESPAFFCFHTINAYEEPSPTHPGETDIVADLARYPNMDVMKRFYFENLTSTSPNASNYELSKGESTLARLTRYRLPAVTSPAPNSPRNATEVFCLPWEHSAELPTINPSYATLPHRYIYGITAHGHSSFLDGLMKMDIVTQVPLIWRHKGQSAGEPIFVANPEGTAEDDGVLLSVVLDGYKGKSYLLCLDARDLSELGRADVDGIVGFGFHGLHVPAEG